MRALLDHARAWVTVALWSAALLLLRAAAALYYPDDEEWRDVSLPEPRNRDRLH